ncbi:MAG: ABC transporter permease [Egibacteraceae bacterium]
MRRLHGVGRLVAVRAALAVPLVVLVTIGLFALGKASPFDPVRQYAGERAFTTSKENLDEIRHNWGLDRPAHEQYLAWASNLARGDLGPSRSQHRPVTQVISERIGWSLLLVVPALGLLLVGSLVVGTLAAVLRGSVVDRVVTGAAYVLAAAPIFWLALGVLWLFAVRLGWLPAAGVSDVAASGRTPTDVLMHLVLPVAVLAVSQSSWFVLFVRETVLGTLREDFVTAARARGLPERTVVSRHALRSALLPWITLVGTHMPELITGSILVETVFSWPGLGATAVEAGLAFDFPLLAAITALGTLAVVGGNLLADLAYAVADPRVALDG